MGRGGGSFQAYFSFNYLVFQSGPAWTISLIIRALSVQGDLPMSIFRSLAMVGLLLQQYISRSMTFLNSMHGEFFRIR